MTGICNKDPKKRRDVFFYILNDNVRRIYDAHKFHNKLNQMRFQSGNCRQ